MEKEKVNEEKATYETKFQYGDVVQISKGFYKETKVKIKDVRKTSEGFNYKVSILTKNSFDDKYKEGQIINVPEKILKKENKGLFSFLKV